MQGQRIVLADRGQVAMGRAASAHIVFRMDLEETDIRQRPDDLAEMLVLETDTGARRNRPGAE